VQLRFRHPGEKDTGGERGRRVGRGGSNKKASKNKTEHTLQSHGGNWSIAKKAELLCSSQPLLEALQAGSR